MSLLDCECGGKPQVLEQSGWWYVECPKCKRGITAYPTREKAADVWNYCRRVDALEEKERSEHGNENKSE